MPATHSSKAAKPGSRVPAIDKGVDLPPARRPQADSFITALVELEPLETLSRAVRLDGESAVHADVKDEAERLRKTVSGQIGKAKERKPGIQFTLATGDFRAPNGDILVVIAVTRTE